MRFLAPAKVNLFLQILAKRNDGYHEIRTLMQPIALFDELEIELIERGLELIVAAGEVPQGLDNLAARAAQLFLDSSGIRKGVRINLRKGIPAAAGLGGGSSDAASILKALNKMLQANWDKESLQLLGAKLGADVPFFIEQKPALAEGVGEKIRPVLLPEGLWFLLILAPFQIASSWAYRTYDELGLKSEKEIVIKESYSKLEELLAILINDLEKPAFNKYPELGIIKMKLLEKGAPGALMSGSGPTIYGLFSSEEEAREVAYKLSLPPGWRIKIVSGWGEAKIQI